MASNAAELRALARDLRRARTSVLPRETASALRRTARSSFAPAKQSAEAALPSGGGRGRRRVRTNAAGQTRSGSLAPGESAARRGVLAQYRASKKSSSAPGVTKYRVMVSPRTGKSIDLQAADRGILRHPLFGNRRFWYTQRIPPGWFTRPEEEHANATAPAELEKAVDKVADLISGP